MVLFLLLAGLLLTAAGVATIGLGLPVDVFNLGTFGNSLLVAGTVALTGGLLLIGLAGVVRQLQRVVAGLAAQPAKQIVSAAEPPEPAVSPTVRATPAPTVQPKASDAVAPQPTEPRSIEPRITEPRPIESRPTETRSLETRAPQLRASELRTYEPRNAEPRASDPRPPEPRAAETRSEPLVPETASAPPSQPPLRWLRPKPQPAAADEPAATADLGAEPAATPRAEQPSESDEPKVWPPARDDASSDPRPEREAHVAPTNGRAKDSGLFDVSWPTPKPTLGETSRPDQTGDAPSRRRRPEAAAERRPAATPEPEPRPAPAVLKSGVIDGMAYTLYADGSIEAELPQGTLTFASVDELRLHLEKHGG